MLALFAVAPPSAHAGTVSRVVVAPPGSPFPAQVIYAYRAGRGEANRVRVRQVQSGGNGVVITDSTGTVSPQSPDCVANGSTEAQCIAPASVEGRRVERVSVTILTADRDDRVRAGGAVTGRVLLGSGNDRAVGGDGALVIFGSSGNDRVRSGAGADFLEGGPGADLLDGGRGEDSVRGGRGNDRLFGGAGADRISDGGGVDRVFGDSGADRIQTRGNRRRVEEVSCGRGRDLVLRPDRFLNLGRDCELAETGRGDRLFVRPLRVDTGALVFLAGCTKRGCLASTRAGTVLSVRLGTGRGRALGRRRYRVGLLGSEQVHVPLSRAELGMLRAPGGSTLQIRAAGMAYRLLIRLR